MFSTPQGRRIGWALVYLLVAALALSVVGVVAAIRQTQIEGTPNGRKILAASERILDCTDPEGECYQQGRKQTADAVSDVNRVVVLAAACSIGLDRDLPVSRRQIIIQDCVIERLSVLNAKP